MRKPTTSERLTALENRFDSLESKIDMLLAKQPTAKTSDKKSSGKVSNKTSSKKSSVEFDRKKYLATAKKLASEGKVRLRENGTPWKADRPIVYKAMGIK